MSQAAAKQNNKKPRTAITPTRDEDFPLWYQEVIKAADLAENSPVRGCMIIKPNGYALWENIKTYLDALIKDEGVQNAYFPLLIPLSYIAKEAEHIDGFAKECAVVTHHRLEADEENGGLKPAGELSEPYIIRPTSETIIGESMARWIQSYRDLPLKLNQWANVMRWEMRPRIFLRTSEFLWQEGHNAFATPEDAIEDMHTMIEAYRKVAEDFLAIPVFVGEKTADERFPGAVSTLTIEAMMQDGKALQAGTSHYLGTTFSKAENISYQNQEGEQTLCHTTSWGLSTRMIGGLIMTHSDDDGLVLPPNVAPTQVVILPFLKNNDGDESVMKACDALKFKLKEKGVRAHLDDRDMRSGDKMWDNVKKGIPLRAEIGSREADNGEVTITRRDLGKESKRTIKIEDFANEVITLLADIQKSMFDRAKERMLSRIQDCSSLDEARAYFEKDDNVGFARIDVTLMDDPEFEKLKNDLSISTRCMPLDDKGEKVLIGKSY